MGIALPSQGAADVENQSIAVRFRIRLTPRTGDDPREMRNCNFFVINTARLIQTIVNYMSGTISSGFSAGVDPLTEKQIAQQPSRDEGKEAGDHKANNMHAFHRTPMTTDITAPNAPDGERQRHQDHSGEDMDEG